jgi:methylase of polypeptide subunit release factors
MDDEVLAGYSASALELIPRFEAVSPDRLYEHVIDLLPARSSRIADIGAGTGRDAEWLAHKGQPL